MYANTYHTYTNIYRYKTPFSTIKTKVNISTERWEAFAFDGVQDRNYNPPP